MITTTDELGVSRFRINLPIDSHAAATYRSAGSLGFQDPLTLQADLREEMADLRSVYTPPRGARYLAWLDETPMGTAGFAVGPDGAAEIRRLYVRPAGRGHNLGAVLMHAALTGAAELGCRTAWLETMPGLMETAIDIYRRLGFRERATDEVSVPGSIRMERPLAPAPDLSADRDLVRETAAPRSEENNP